MKTKAAVLYQLGKPLIVEDLEIPELQEGQVLVEMLYSGLCHSQINEIDGMKGEDNFLPHLLGHEGSGIVREIGAGVNKVKEGDYVVLSWIKGSGKEVSNSKYQKNTINSGAITTFNTYSVISENRLFKIPVEIPSKIAALLGCAIPTGAGIVKNEVKLNKEDAIAIFGVGGIGSCALLYASSRGASKIIAIDINDYKLDFAKKIGATHTINCLKENLAEKVKLITENEGVDFAIESSGVKTAMETAIDVIKNSGTVIIAGNLKKGEKIAIDPFELIKGKKIIGTWGGATNPDKDIPHYSEKYLEGKLPLEELITKIYSLEQINDAVQDLKEGKIIRGLIKLK